jgi:hypothetical protein
MTTIGNNTQIHDNKTDKDKPPCLHTHWAVYISRNEKVCVDCGFKIQAITPYTLQHQR